MSVQTTICSLRLQLLFTNLVDWARCIIAINGKGKSDSTRVGWIHAGPLPGRLATHGIITYHYHTPLLIEGVEHVLQV